MPTDCCVSWAKGDICQSFGRLNNDGNNDKDGAKKKPTGLSDNEIDKATVSVNCCQHFVCLDVSGVANLFLFCCSAGNARRGGAEHRPQESQLGPQERRGEEAGEAQQEDTARDRRDHPRTHGRGTAYDLVAGWHFFYLLAFEAQLLAPSPSVVLFVIGVWYAAVFRFVLRLYVHEYNEVDVLYFVCTLADT